MTLSPRVKPLALVAAVLALLLVAVFVAAPVLPGPIRAAVCNVERSLPFRSPLADRARCPAVVVPAPTPGGGRGALPVVVPRRPLTSGPRVVLPTGETVEPESRPPSGFRPVAVVLPPAAPVGTDSVAAPPPPLIIDAPEGESGPGLFPELFPRPPVSVRTVGGRPASGAVAFQPPPVLAARVAPLAGVELVAGGPRAFVAVSPVRVWALRPDVGVSVPLDTLRSLRYVLANLRPEVGVSVEVVNRLRVRVAVPAASLVEPDPSAVSLGVAYRFR